jgi:integral membrane protein (TIGR01906 family)
MHRLGSLASWLIIALVPFALVGLGVRALLTPAFLQFEYHLPNFPPDDYGFTTADRLHWGTYGITYLTNDADISYLGSLTFPDGSAVFNPRELSHMRDVKAVTQRLLRIWWLILGVIGLLGVLAWLTRTWPAFLAALRAGGRLTLILALALGLVGTVGGAGSGDLFWQFFSDFHHLFFSGNSWLFSFSDTLIRLYPIRFWEDAVLYIGIVTALGAALLAFAIRPPRQPRQR